MTSVWSEQCLGIRRVLLRIATVLLILMSVGVLCAQNETPPPPPAADASSEPFLSDEDMASVGVPAGARSGDSAPSVGGALVDMALALVVVIGLVGAASWTVKRSGARRKLLGSNSRHLQLVETLPLGLKRAVSLVRLGDRVVLVGQSEQGLAALGEFGAGIIDGHQESTEAASPEKAAAPNAAIDRLSGLIGQLITTRQTAVASVIPAVTTAPAPESPLVDASEPEPKADAEADPQPEHATDRIARFQERLREATERRV